MWSALRRQMLAIEQISRKGNAQCEMKVEKCDLRRKEKRGIVLVSEVRRKRQSGPKWPGAWNREGARNMPTLKVDSQANAFIMLLPVLWLLSTTPIPLSREANEPWSNQVRMALIHSWTTRSEESEVDEEMPQSAPAPHAPLRRAVPLPSAEPQYCITGSIRSHAPSMYM
ncbi:hypothetical protein LTR12_000829 [Friedmanniomyces endolithicus]|nr:hypothetical protein LTR12_000829 [Friedmanniomyces endolithicus]